MPVLKGRVGELRALEMVNPVTRGLAYPLLEVVPVAGALRDTLARLGRAWPGPVMLDGFYLAAQLGGGVTPVRAVMEAARDVLHAVPVVRLSDGEAVRSDVAATEAGHGVAVRVTIDQLSADPGLIGLDLQELARACRVPLDRVDLVVDLASVGSRAAVAHGALIAEQLLAGIKSIGELRTVVVAAGSAPVDLRDVTPWTITEKPRHDAVLWERLVARGPVRVPVFGDYGVAHPWMPPPETGFPLPQLSYTVAGRWLMLRGQRGDRRSNAHFRAICEQVCGHPEFSGPQLGEADDWIASAWRRSPGDASTWRALGTAHHADFVVSRLSGS